MKRSTSASVKFAWVSLEKPTCSIRLLKVRPWALALAGIQQTEEKAGPRSNEKTIGGGGGGEDAGQIEKQPPLNP